MGHIMSEPDHATTDRLSERAHESVDQIATTAGKTEERLRHEAAGAETRVKGARKKAQEQSDEALYSISSYVREKPLKALGIAFAAGALVSALRRRS